MAKGYIQQDGIDFLDTFSPVAKVSTIRTLLGLTVAKNWPLHQSDVNNAFSNGDLHEELYMEAPEGYSIPSRKVLKLHK